MTDREKVIGGLELLAHWPDGLIITDKEKWIKPCCEMAIALLKEQEGEYERGFNDAMLGKQHLMYEDVDGKWHEKDW